MSDAPDEYELRYMDADSALARVRQRQAWWLPATVLASATLLIAMMAPLLWRMAQTPGGRGIALVFAAGYALEFLALFPAMIIGHIVRAVVTPTHLRVHIGLRRAEVPLSAITSLSVEPVRWWRISGEPARRAARPRAGLHHLRSEALSAARMVGRSGSEEDALGAARCGAGAVRPDRVARAGSHGRKGGGDRSGGRARGGGGHGCPGSAHQDAVASSGPSRWRPGGGGGGGSLIQCGADRASGRLRALPTSVGDAAT